MRYSIILNNEELEDIDLSFSDADDVAKAINVDEFMEDFEIVGDEAHMVLTGTFKGEIVEEFGSVNNIISEMETMNYIKDIRRSNL